MKPVRLGDGSIAIPAEVNAFKCPFCYSLDVKLWRQSGLDVKRGTYTECGNCLARGPWVDSRSNDALIEAVLRWNVARNA